MKTLIEFDDIDELGPQEYRAVVDLSPAELESYEVSGLGSVTIEVRVDQGHVEDEYVADGTATFNADFSCSRCLEPYPVAQTSTFHVRFRPRPAVAPGDEELEITAEEELNVEFYSERAVTLRDLAVEQVQLTIPMKPLCEEGCLGLCAHCGSNRNRETCKCAETETDQRWGALQDIRERLAKKKEM